MGAAPAEISDDSWQLAFRKEQALGRLVAIARGDTGQSARVANFLLAWWNADRDGGFDFTDLWMLDEAIVDDILLVIKLIANNRCYGDAFGFEAEFNALVKQWRPQRCAKRKRK